MHQEATSYNRGQAPEALFVHLAHATRAGHDQRLRLAPAPLPAFCSAAPTK